MTLFLIFLRSIFALFLLSIVSFFGPVIEKHLAYGERNMESVQVLKSLNEYTKQTHKDYNEYLSKAFRQTR